MEKGAELRAVEVVGIVSNHRMGPMLPGDVPDPKIYTLFRPDGGPFTLWIKSANRDELFNDLRSIVRELDPRLPWLSLKRGEDMYIKDAPTIRQVAFTIGGLGLLALALAVIGLYAVMSYVVMLRRHEISVRIAIGAKSRDIVRLMLTHAARLVIMGAAIGLTLALILALILRATLFAAPLLAPGTFLPQLALMTFATLVAAFIPAYFASRINPMQMLKVD
jgi:putative ABC transport system permease protein